MSSLTAVHLLAKKAGQASDVKELARVVKLALEELAGLANHLEHRVLAVESILKNSGHRL